MNQWPGNPGRKPAKPPDNQSVRKPAAPKNRAIEPTYEENYVEEDDLTQAREAAPVMRAPARPGQTGAPRPNPNFRGSTDAPVDPLTASQQQDHATRIEIGKRAVALIIDLVVCYFAAVVILVVPFVNRFLDVNLILMTLFLFRDFPFEGRGIGKNVMGLRVIDSVTLKGPSLLQSAKRNVILIAPTLVARILSLVLHLLPIGVVIHFVDQIVNIVGTFYYIIVLPLEGYRAYSRADGMRFGDELAGTELTESAMDFSKPLPRDR